MKIHDRRYFNLLQRELPLPHELVLMCIPQIKVRTEMTWDEWFVSKFVDWEDETRVFYGGIQVYTGPMDEIFWNMLEMIYLTTDQYSNSPHVEVRVE